MPQLIRNRAIEDDRWTLVRDSAQFAAVSPNVPVIVPLAFWKQERDALTARGDVGVWLAPSDDPAALAVDVGQLPLIAVDFPKFTDGRGYSTGRLLREKYGYTGELRAIGDILRDQLYYLHACGFNAFAVRADRDLADALKGLADFSDNYQTTVDRPVPLFRRRGALNTGAPRA
jgi:uncharacterized protein (DUF934 family)